VRYVVWTEISQRCPLSAYGTIWSGADGSKPEYRDWLPYSRFEAWKPDSYQRLNDATLHMIDTDSIALMKKGVMLINTARGALVNTSDVLDAVNSGNIGYYGADVYEFEKGLFFEDHEADQVRDALLSKLLEHPNVLVTPHQAFLTFEALRDIADQTMANLDVFENQVEILSSDTI
jgi:lactate dehydrogenase-like 2-hydroxyacid dehydrogenase